MEPLIPAEHLSGWARTYFYKGPEKAVEYAFAKSRLLEIFENVILEKSHKVKRMCSEDRQYLLLVRSHLSFKRDNLELKSRGKVTPLHVPPSWISDTGEDAQRHMENHSIVLKKAVEILEEAEYDQSLIDYLKNRIQKQCKKKEFVFRFLSQKQPSLEPHEGLKVTAVRKKGFSGRGQCVGVIEDSPALIHMNLKRKFWYDGKQGVPPNNHATHVAGIIAADHTHDWVGGVAPQVSLFLVTRLESMAMFTTIKFINWSGYGDSKEYIEKELLKSEPRVLIQAMGNGLEDNNFHGEFFKIQPFYPHLNNPEIRERVILVANYQEFDGKYVSLSLSSVFPGEMEEISLCAPGENILSTVVTTEHSFANYSGTSMAAPHVTGICAIISEAFPDLNALEIRDCVLQGSDRLAWDGSYFGVVVTEEVFMNLSLGIQTLSKRFFGRGVANAEKAFNLAEKLIQKKRAEELPQQPIKRIRFICNSPKA